MRLKKTLMDHQIPKTAWGAYLLADDFVHNKIQKTAERVGKKTGLERKTLAYCSFIAGSASSAAILSSSPLHSALVALFSAMALLPLRNLIEKASEFRESAGAVAEDEVRFAANLMFKAIRLPAFAAALWKIIEGVASHDLHSLAMGVYFAGFSITAYLVTSGTGMLDKAKKFLLQLKEQAVDQFSPEPQPVPIPNR